MNEKNDWPVLIKEIEHLLRLRTFPVGVRFIENEEELEKIDKKKLRRPNKYSFTCQLLTLARTYGHTFVITEGCLMPECSNIIGFSEIPEKVKDGTFRNVAWCKTKEDGKKFEEAIPRLPLGKYRAILMGPQSAGLYEPDIVLFYGNPAQMIFIVNALQFEDYERLTSYCVGESSSCAETLVQSLLDGKPHLSLPCFGERRYGHAQDDEVVMVVPGKQVEKVKRNLSELFKRGVRYPIAYFGAGVDLCPGLPPVYHEILNITGYYD